MPKNKENFIDKFILLNSQDCSEEIIWSSSPASDVENTTNNFSFSRSNIARRVKRTRKKSLPKKFPSLNVKVIDVPRNISNVADGEKSPILCSNSLDQSPRSPIFKPGCKRKHKNEPNSFIDVVNRNTSPILTTKNSKSPILSQKSPTSKVRKKIFNDCYLSKRTDCDVKEKLFLNLDKEITDKKSERYSFNYDVDNICQSSKRIKIDSLTSTSGDLNQVEDSSTRYSKANILNRVKSYFDSHFSSGTTSCISEDSTPRNSSPSDEIETFTSLSQSPKEQPTIKIEKTKDSKKSRYKKDGLSSRLSNLVKKQNANFNLWRHEKFLAGNAHFSVPIMEHIFFRVKFVEFKYGCVALNTVDLNEIKYTIVINKEFVIENIVPDSILKLYKPYTVKNFNNINLITNVCKFENYTISCK